MSITPPIKPELAQANIDMQNFVKTWTQAIQMPVQPNKSPSSQSCTSGGAA